MEFSVVIPLDPEYIARELSDQLSNAELIEFIVALDLHRGDWGFTEELYKWAKGEHKIYKAEVKEYGR